MLLTVRVLPVSLDADFGWIVETTHETAIVERKVVWRAHKHRPPLIVGSIWTKTGQRFDRTHG
jgi:hypothetical protein